MLKTMTRKLQEKFLKFITSLVLPIAMCGVGSPPKADLRGEHGQRELKKIVTTHFAPEPLAVLSPRWKVLAKLHKWKTKQLLIMLCTVWRVRPLVTWELDLLLEILKICKHQGIEWATVGEIVRKYSPTCRETLYAYRRRLRTLDHTAYWCIGHLVEAPSAPLRSADPRRMASIARSYRFLLKWIRSERLPATQFRTVEKRRKRGYDDHGSLSSRSRADKLLAEELAQQCYEKLPDWRKLLGYSSLELFLEHALQQSR
jgi:hypothetical protein